MNAVILCVGKLKEKWQQDGCNEYLKRLTRYGKYEIVQVEMGTKVLAGGSCDIMLRSGTAVAIAPLATQGLSDYTTGTEILDGEDITINHMMLIPRGDGRGILITSDIAYIMIRGAYALES